MTRRASLDTEISVTGLEIFSYEHSSPVTGMKLERLHLLHLGNRAEISHMNSNRAEISPYEWKANFVALTEPVRLCAIYVIQ